MSLPSGHKTRIARFRACVCFHRLRWTRDKQRSFRDIGAVMSGDRDKLPRRDRAQRPAGKAGRTGGLARAIILAATAATLAGSPSDPAHAQKLDARYVISMTGIRVGQSTWTVTIEEDRYSAAASGGSVDILSVLVRGEGAAQVSGAIKDARLIPTTFSSTLVEDGEKGDVKVTFDGDIVTDVKDTGSPPGPDRVALTSAHVQGVTDPLTALLVPDEGGEASCNRTLAIFDGRRRYDLVLSFKRMEKLRSNEPVVVCSVVLRPIAGHRANSMIMKYVAERRDMEIAFAPITGTRFLAPLRLLVPTLIGTMAVQATAFQTSPLVARQ